MRHKYRLTKLQLIWMLAFVVLSGIALYLVWVQGTVLLFGIPVQLLLATLAIPAILAAWIFLFARKLDELAWLDEDER